MMEVGKEFNAYTKPIRGGTDGSRLSEMGLPTPDLWNGTDNFHSVKEFNVVKEAVEAVVYLQRLLMHKWVILISSALLV